MLGELQIRLKIPQRASDVVEVIGEKAAVAQLAERRRRERHEQLGDGARLRKRAHVHVDALQVEQHPDDDLRRAWRARSSDLLNAILAADVLLQQHAAVVLREQRAAVERIDDADTPVVRLPTSGQRTRKCPGKLMPSMCRPARRATSM